MVHCIMINRRLLDALLLFGRATNHADPRDILERDLPILPLFPKEPKNADHADET